MNTKYLLLGLLIVLLVFIGRGKLFGKTKNKGGKTVFDGTKSNYLTNMYSVAKSIEKNTGIPFDFILAQTALETGWGKSTLVRDAFNFGGIKALAGQPFVIRKTKEYINNQLVTIDAKFRKFDSLQDGLSGYAKLLTSGRYQDCVENANGNALKFAECVKSQGYATDPNYVNKIANMLISVHKGLKTIGYE